MINNRDVMKTKVLYIVLHCISVCVTVFYGAEPVKTQQVTVPADPSEVFLRYNELQISQGYDLLQYSGKELTRYVYRITNYPDESGVYYATLLVKDGQVVGADVASSAKTGVMHGLKMP